MLTFSICVLFQTSSKKACETNKTQATGQPHKAIKGFISGRNFHNIRRQLDKKELPHKRLVKTTTHWKFKPHQAKGFIRRRNFHNIRRKLHKKRIVDCVKYLFYNYLKSCDIYEAEFACFYNI